MDIPIYEAKLNYNEKILKVDALIYLNNWKNFHYQEDEDVPRKFLPKVFTFDFESQKYKGI